VFREAVRATKAGPAHDIPHITADLTGKYLTDLKVLRLV
jgi:fatty acid CoA ligase FadD9